MTLGLLISLAFFFAASALGESYKQFEEEEDNIHYIRI